MRAMAVTDYSVPLQLLELPDPDLVPGSVLVRILACGVCYTDLKICRGQMAFSADLHLPHVPGHEICGEVIEAEPKTGWRVGDLVVVYNYWSCGRCFYCRAGQDQLCQALRGWVGFTSPGGFQEFLVVPSDFLLRVPEGVRPEQAAVGPCALGTAYRAVVTKGRVEPGETVVVLGLGGLGIHALQVIQAVGANAIGVDVEPGKLAAARRLGAMGVAIAGDEALGLVQLQTSGQGADVVLDTVGHSETLYEAALMTRRGGRVIGLGYVVDGFARIQTDLFVLREIQFIGSRYMQRNELMRALDLVARGKVSPVIDALLPLQEANQALDRLDRGQVVGRTVLRPHGT